MVNAGRQRLIIFSHTFPYGNQDQFLRAELPFTSNSVFEIFIVPLVGVEGTPDSLPENVKVLPPVFARKSLTVLSLKLFEALKSKFFISNFFKYFWSFKKLKQIFIVSVFRNYLTRMNLPSEKHDLWYFYWGVNLASYLAFFSVPPKTIVRFHNYDLYEELGDVSFRKELLENIDKAVCISEHGLEYLKSMYPEYAGKIILSKLGTDDHGINPQDASDKFVVVSCSNVISTKRVELIAKAVGLLKVPVRWIHFGDGPLFSKILSLAEKMPENVEVILPGRVKNKDILDYYSKNHVDLFINVSVSEGIPVSIMEAISFGIPVLATKITGNVEITNDNLGGLVPLNVNPEELAQKISELLNKDSIQNLRFEARNKWVENYSALKNFSNFKRLLEEL